jgi:hypothetical protein
VPPEPSIITAAPVVWTLGPENMQDRGNYFFLRNGQRIEGASGKRIVNCNGEPLFYGRRGSWWRFTSSGNWSNTNSATLPCTVTK